MKQVAKWGLLCAILLLVGCQKAPKEEDNSSFTYLMGEKTPLWEFVSTAEDRDHLEQLGTVYAQNQPCKADLQMESKVPKVIHFIWVGPHSFPSESISNIAAWVQHHPEYTCKFWTDRVRPLPHPKMELHLINKGDFDFFETAYQESDNFAEKSDLLRYELLYREGGIYVDHDVQCFKSFSELVTQYDLFCGIEPPHAPVMSSSISICNNLIGTRPNHPVMKETIDRVLERWHDVAAMFPEKDNQSVIYRIAHRTFSPFDEAFRAKNNQSGRKDIALPAAFFNKIGGQFGFFSHHQYASTWFESEPKFEKLTRRRLVKLCKKNNQILLLNGVILFLNLILITFLLTQRRTAK